MLRRTTVTILAATAMLGLHMGAATAAGSSLTVKTGDYVNSAWVTARGTITCPKDGLYRVDGTLAQQPRRAAAVIANGSDDDRSCTGDAQPFWLDLYASGDTGLTPGHASLALSVYGVRLQLRSL
jgi:hypothetical protein